MKPTRQQIVPRSSLDVPTEGVLGRPTGDAAHQNDSKVAQTSETVSRRQKRLQDVPRKYRGLYRKAWAGDSRKAAIRTFCLECVGWMPEEVRQCTAPACPLYEFRLKG